MEVPQYPFTTDWQEPIPVPDYLLKDPSWDAMTDEEIREYFLDSEADRAIEEEKSNPYPPDCYEC